MQFFVYFTMSGDQPPMKPSSPPTPEKMAEIGKFHQDAMESGVIVATGRLNQNITRVRAEGEEVSVTDGPFMEGKELIPGFTIIQTDTREQALAWVTNYRAMMGMPELRISEISM